MSCWIYSRAVPLGTYLLRSLIMQLSSVVLCLCRSVDQVPPPGGSSPSSLVTQTVISHHSGLKHGQVCCFPGRSDSTRSCQRSVHTAGTTPQFLELFSRKIASASAKWIWLSGSCRKITSCLGSSHSFWWSLEIPIMVCIIYIASQFLLQKKLKKCPNAGALLGSNGWAFISEAALVARDAPYFWEAQNCMAGVTDCFHSSLLLA